MRRSVSIKYLISLFYLVIAGCGQIDTGAREPGKGGGGRYASQGQARNETHLLVGQAKTVWVNASQFWNLSEVTVRENEEYQFSANPYEIWLDLTIPANGAGYPMGVFVERCAKVNFGICAMTKSIEGIARIESERRVPNANFFTLIGNLDQNPTENFAIGLGVRKTFAKAGKLNFFANDWPTRYANNSGAVSVLVTRLR